MDRDEYVKSIKTAFVTIGSKGVLAALAVQMPFFASGIGQKIAEFIVEIVLKILVNLAEMQIFFMYIDMRTAKQREGFEEAAIANRIAQENGSPEEKARAEQALIDAFRQFAKFNT